MQIYGNFIIQNLNFLYICINKELNFRPKET